LYIPCFLGVFPSSGRNSGSGEEKGEIVGKGGRKGASTPKLNCRGKWQAGHE